MLGVLSRNTTPSLKINFQAIKRNLLGMKGGKCYDCFFSLTMFSSCSPFLFFLVDFPLSPRTSISTDRFSRADYVVPLTHRFPLPSLLFYNDASLRLGQALLGLCTPFLFYINSRTSCIFSLTLTYSILPQIY